jgi:hypothetical protein
MCGLKPEVDRIAIGFRAGSPAGTNASVGPADVFDDDGLFSESLIRAASTRPNTSVGPPAANATIMVMGRVG